MGGRVGRTLAVVGGIVIMVAAIGPAAAAVIEGTNGPDTLYGTPFDDVIHGRDGRDFLNGRGGADSLNGGAGGDRLYGGGGRDQLSGRAGNDRLVGGDHADYVSAGPGNDVIRLFGDGRPDHAACGGGWDTVYYGPEDFVEGDCEERIYMGTGTPPPFTTPLPTPSPTPSP